MITRHLEHFTQDEVDKAVTETLTKDLPYGGNRPYVIGTILRDSSNGEYVLWRKGSTEAHRLCIEHAPHEFVEWTIATETMSSAIIDLQQLTRNYPFAKVKRIGMIPLSATPDGAPGTYYDSAYCVSTSSSSPDLHDVTHCFTLLAEQCELKLTQVTPLTQPTYCELDALLYAPYFTDKVYFTNLHFALSPRGAVFYCVYELNDGLVHYPASDAKRDESNTEYGRPMFKIPFTSGYLKYICVNNGDFYFSVNYAISLNLYKYKFTGTSFNKALLWYQGRANNARNCFYNVERKSFHFEYGTFVALEYITTFDNTYRGVDGYLRFTSDKFNS